MITLCRPTFMLLIAVDIDKGYSQMISQENI